MDVVRFGVSMDRELVRLLDELTSGGGYANRSETLRALVRREATRLVDPGIPGVNPGDGAFGNPGDGALDGAPAGAPTKVSEAPSTSSGAGGGSLVTGIVSVVYRRGNALREVPIAPHPSLQILSNLKLHLNPHMILTVIVLQGIKEDVYRWGQQVIRQRNVLGDISIVASEPVLEVMGGGNG